MKKKGAIILGLFIGAISISCGNSKKIVEETQIDSFNLSDTTVIMLNEIILCNDDLALFVQFDSVINESRCPYNTNCIWEGNAEVGFSVTYKKELAKISLNTNPKMETKKSAYGFVFELIELNPYPGIMNADKTPISAKIAVTKE
jgi:hypothetical protein